MSSLDNFSSSEGLSVPFPFKRELIRFKRETIISTGLLDINSDGAILRAKPSAELFVDLARSPLFPVGDAPVLSLCLVEGQLSVMYSFAHLRFIPDETSLVGEEQYLVAVTSPKSDKAILLSFYAAPPAQLYLDGFDIKLLTKREDEEVIRNLPKMQVSATSKDDSLPVQNCAAVPPALFKFLLSQNASTPTDCLLATLSWLDQQNLSAFTASNNKKTRRPLSAPLRDLLSFLVLGCVVPDDLKNAACSMFEPLPAGELYSKSQNLVLQWTQEAVEEEGGEQNVEDPPVQVDTEQPPPFQVEHVVGQSTQAADCLSRPQVVQAQQTQIPQQQNVANDLLVGLIEAVGGLKKKSSTTFFDTIGNERLSKAWCLLGSDGISTVVDVPDGVQALYKQKDGAAMARFLNSVSRQVSVQPAVMSSLRSSLETNTLYNQQPNGLSIFMCKAKDESVEIADIMGTADSVAPALLPDLMKGHNFQDLLHSKVTAPKTLTDLELVLLGYGEILESLIPGSLLCSKYSELMTAFTKNKANFNSFFRIQGKDLLITFLNGVNSKIAKFVNSCWDLSPKPSLLNFEELMDDIASGTFMNRWKIESAALSVPTQTSQDLDSKPTKKPKKKQKVERVCDCPDLAIENWGEKANVNVRKTLEESKGISTPVIRSKEMCCRFYFSGSCNKSNCNTRAHFVNLTPAEKAKIAKYRAELLALNMTIIDAPECKSLTMVDEISNSTPLFDEVVMDTEDTSDSAPLLDGTTRAPSPPSKSPPTIEVMKRDFVSNIARILNSPSLELPPPPFMFENTERAKIFNSKLIEEFDYDLDRLFDAHLYSAVHPGAEFRSSEEVECLLSVHKDWEKLKKIMDEGVDLGVSDERTEQEKLSDFQEAFDKGNSSTMKDPEAKKSVKENQFKEVDHGRAIPITLECAAKLKDAGITPLGCAVQWTIDEMGKPQIKRRTTHNLSSQWGSGKSLNEMVEEDKLEEIYYGPCLKRCSFQIHQMRLNNPLIPILLAKFDIDAAFRRMSVLLRYSPMFLSVLDDTAYLDLRMPFGSNQGPGKFCLVSETVTDVANHLMNNEFFDPKKLKSSFSDSVPRTNVLPEDIEFGFAIPLLHETEERRSYWDVFVDDMINILLKDIEMEAKAREAAAIALELLFRPLAKNEYIKRNTILKITKLRAEGRLEELKIVLGWLFNTRLFRIYIPDEKGRRWLHDLSSIIDKGCSSDWVTKQELESLIGKLNEAAHICNEGRFFLAHIRNCLSRAEKYTRAKLHKGEILDLELWTVLLKKLMVDGRSLNHVNPTIPSLFLKQDASSEEGIGGFNDLGFAWRYIFDTAIKGNDFIHINTWEQLAGVVNIWYAILLLDIDNGQGMKFLDQSDNMTALKWMLTSKYYDSKEHVQSILLEQTEPSQRREDGSNSDGLTGGDYLMDRIDRARSDATHGVTKGTCQKDKARFGKWEKFTTKADLDTFLLTTDKTKRNAILCAFAYAIRNNEFGFTTQDKLQRDTVQTTIDTICKTFRANGLPDPSLDQSSEKCIQLKRQLMFYEKQDGPVKRQPALPLAFFWFIVRNLAGLNEHDRAIYQLIILAFFYMARSCEYSDTPNSQDKKTKKLCLKDFIFFVDGSQVGWNHENIGNASAVAITFNAKNGVKNDTVTNSKTGNDLCPVLTAVKIVQRIRGYPNTNRDTHVDVYLIDGKLKHVKSPQIGQRLQSVARTMGQQTLGLDPNSIGTHSLRCSLALMLHLAGKSDSYIKLHGRWLSLAFMAYIKRQIAQLDDDTLQKITNSSVLDFLQISINN
ncbi:hypothetical protein CTEN210_10363 [Chaetoceros tenuissimus]|uniref:Uncharacterized protein n=1 Tax=Chaetoceros tenuissimus TaxID=426638 RepID=A0AAD3CXI6_9STRA|nr:hypothetical protein CTEN210_10363 [Chaetoceros tenuissimus]